jgi:hypothetical protein
MGFVLKSLKFFSQSATLAPTQKLTFLSLNAFSNRLPKNECLSLIKIISKRIYTTHVLFVFINNFSTVHFSQIKLQIALQAE